MGYILCVYKVYPEEPESIEQIKEFVKTNIKEPFKLNNIDEEPIAFGLVLLKIGIVFPDKIDGLMDQLEEFLKSAPGVKEIENELSTLIS